MSGLIWVVSVPISSYCYMSGREWAYLVPKPLIWKNGHMGPLILGHMSGFWAAYEGFELHMSGFEPLILELTDHWTNRSYLKPLIFATAHMRFANLTLSMASCRRPCIYMSGLRYDWFQFLHMIGSNNRSFENFKPLIWPNMSGFIWNPSYRALMSGFILKSAHIGLSLILKAI